MTNNEIVKHASLFKRKGRNETARVAKFIAPTLPYPTLL
jgi:hypothetical protein